ncbi:MAG: hypothetical protein NC228_01300, partial [[Eubacterium] siraeum]|nr:hypothetical protein [[Eubacterium] siraeum]
MTEMDFLRILNDIDDKFIDEEIEGETEPLAPAIFRTDGKNSRAFWVKLAGAAAVCAAAVGGLAYLKTAPDIFVKPSVTEELVQFAVPETEE